MDAERLVAQYSATRVQANTSYPQRHLLALSNSLFTVLVLAPVWWFSLRGGIVPHLKSHCSSINILVREAVIAQRTR